MGGIAGCILGLRPPVENHDFHPCAQAAGIGSAPFLEHQTDLLDMVSSELQVWHSISETSARFSVDGVQAA